MPGSCETCSFESLDKSTPPCRNCYNGSAYQEKQCIHAARKLEALAALLTEYGVLPLAQRSDLAPPVALNYEQACKIAEVLR